jgi:hypothetical protein
MTDIFAHWKKNKFVTVGYDLLDGPEILVILTDVTFWASHEQELQTWCDYTGSTMTGMTVAFPNEQTLTAFCLRWS